VLVDKQDSLIWQKKVDLSQTVRAGNKSVNRPLKNLKNLDAADLAKDRKKWLKKVAIAYNDHMSSKVVEPNTNEGKNILREAMNQNLNVRLKDKKTKNERQGASHVFVLSR